MLCLVLSAPFPDRGIDNYLPHRADKYLSIVSQGIASPTRCMCLLRS